MEYRQAFEELFPGFFRRESIRALPEEESSLEMALDLKAPPVPAPPCPAGIRFDRIAGDREDLRRAVAAVEEAWVRYFTPESPVLCALEDGQPVSFCLVEEFGATQGLRVGGPGCVGTVPAARNRGIGLRLVWEATRLLREQGLDVGWIHYTYLEDWYGRLGYRTVLRWNCRGFLEGPQKG